MNSKLSKRALNLAYFTIIYNVLEGILSIFAGLSAGSISLIGFGLDSAVESLSAAVIAWRFKKQSNISKYEEERIEKSALKYIGYTFFILAIYVLYESIMKLYNAEISEPSILGILITGTSLIVMPVLFYYKYQIGMALKSRSVIADSKETLACSFLSGAVLLGLLANYFYGFWQADPLIGFLIVIFLLREGYEIFKDI